MATIYRTRKGDVLDRVCYDYYGRSDALIQVYEANPGLVEQPPILPEGLSIQLPDLPAPAAQGEALWD